MRIRNAPKATLPQNTARVICLLCEHRRVGIASRTSEMLRGFVASHSQEHHPLEYVDMLPNRLFYELCWMLKAKPKQGMFKYLLVEAI